MPLPPPVRAGPGPAIRRFGEANNAPVAQLDRVTVSEAVGRGFDSRRARHFLLLPHFTAGVEPTTEVSTRYSQPRRLKYRNGTTAEITISSSASG